MSNRSPKTVRVDDDLWTEFENHVHEQDGNSNGAKPKHLENAIREYLDKGRDARIEEKLDEVLTHVRDDDGSHTHKHDSSGSSRGSETVEKVREIIKRIQTNHETVVSNDDVERSIEDMAGADPRTVEKYKKQLRRRQLLFEHPADSVWTTDREMWVEWCENYADAVPSAEVSDFIEGYGMSHDEYDKIATEVSA